MPENFHVAVGMSGRVETVAAVQAMRVARDELEAPQTLKIRMRHDGLNQPLAEARVRGAISST